MKRWIIYRVRGGWLVTNETSFISQSDIPSVRVFESMSNLTRFLVAESGESERDSKGRFK